MARGIKTIMNADIGISTTGIAGPMGGTSEKPVGTVCFGFALDEMSDAAAHAVLTFAMTTSAVNKYVRALDCATCSRSARNYRAMLPLRV